MLIALHKFQEKAFLSEKQIVINAAGIQSGKTTVGGIFINHRATQINPKHNLIIAAPTYKILSQATLPRFLEYSQGMGKYHKGDSVFKYFHGPTVYIRSLTDPNAMEGITDVEGVWLDEGGLISRYAWENVMGRAAFKEAKVIVTTTPYSLNWLYQLWKDWKAGIADDVDFFSYRSIDNPYFPIKEYNKQKRKLDPVRFAMKYDGQFGKMEGLVYPDVKFIKEIALPAGTRFFGGVDWGYTDPFALTIRAVTPDGIHYRVGEYYKSKQDIDDLIQVCKARKKLWNIEVFICDPSQPAYIRKFNSAGLRAIKANNNIIDGIDDHRTLMRTQRFFVFEDQNPHGRDEYESYHYPEPQDLKIDQDSKEQLPVDKNNHGCDGDRYVSVYLKTAAVRRRPKTPQQNTAIPEDALKRLQWLKKGGSKL
jgi:PBSX family phage terminase large subunit